MACFVLVISGNTEWLQLLFCCSESFFAGHQTWCCGLIRALMPCMNSAQLSTDVILWWIGDLLWLRSAPNGAGWRRNLGRNPPMCRVINRHFSPRIPHMCPNQLTSILTGIHFQFWQSPNISKLDLYISPFVILPEAEFSCLVSFFWRGSQKEMLAKGLLK